MAVKTGKLLPSAERKCSPLPLSHVAGNERKQNKFSTYRLNRSEMLCCVGGRVIHFKYIMSKSDPPS